MYLYNWIYIMSHILNAKNYQYEVCMSNADSRSINFHKSVVHASDKGAQRIRDSCNCSVVTDGGVKHYMAEHRIV